MANVSSPNGIKTNGVPVYKEVRCFVEIEMLGGVSRVVRDSTNGARKVGRIDFILALEENQEFATKFYQACKDGSISKTATFHLFERQITVDLANAGNAPPMLITREASARARKADWKSFFGRGEVASAPADAGNAAAVSAVDPNLPQSSFFPKVGSGSRKLRHDEPFVISGRPETSQILISTEAATSLDGRWIVFGKVADKDSKNIVTRIKRYASNAQNKVFIASSGVGEKEAPAPGTVSAKPEASTSAGSMVSSGQVAAA